MDSQEGRPVLRIHGKGEWQPRGVKDVFHICMQICLHTYMFICLYASAKQAFRNAYFSLHANFCKFIQLLD